MLCGAGTFCGQVLQLELAAGASWAGAGATAKTAKHDRAARQIDPYIKFLRIDGSCLKGPFRRRAKDSSILEHEKRRELQAVLRACHTPSWALLYISPPRWRIALSKARSLSARRPLTD